MTMPVLDGPMTMPVLDGVKPMAIILPICGTSESLFWKRKKSIYCWTRSRPTWTFGESDDQVRDKSESKYQRVQDKFETIEKRLESETGLEYYSPNLMHPLQVLQAPLMSWLVESRVIDEGEIQNVQSWGYSRTGLRTTALEEPFLLPQELLYILKIKSS